MLAFSPATGASMKDCLPGKYFESLEIPLIILRPSNEMESENSKIQFELAKKYNHQTHVAPNGVHGASMLVKERGGSDIVDIWKVAYSFLNKVSRD